MPESRYDCIVIGSGPGGYVAAIRAAQLGMKTAVVEKDRIGGRCLNYACIPAKSVLRAADVLDEVNDAASFGISVDGASVDFAGVGKHRDKVVKTLTGGVGMLFDKNKVDVIEGHGSVTDDGNVKIGGQFDATEIEAGAVVLATGSVPNPILDLEFGGRVLGTETAWALNQRPDRMAVIGAGASGTEVASAFGRLGTEVVLLEMLRQILPLEDEEIAKAAAREIRKQNVEIVTGASIESATSVTVLLLFAVNLAVVMPATANAAEFSRARQIGFGFVAALLVLVAGLILFRWHSKKVVGWFDAKIHPDSRLLGRLKHAIINFLQQLATALGVLTSARELAVTIGWSLALWGSVAAGNLIVFRA